MEQLLDGIDRMGPVQMFWFIVIGIIVLLIALGPVWLWLMSMDVLPQIEWEDEDEEDGEEWESAPKN